MTTIIIPQANSSVNINAYLNPKTRELYRALTNLCRRIGNAWITNAALAKEYGKSIATAKRYVSRLVELGLIRIEIDCRNVYAKRKIFCLVPLSALRPGGFVVSTNEPDSGASVTPTNTVPLPYIQIPEKATNMDATPEVQAEPISPVCDVAHSICVSVQENAVSILQSKPVPLQSPREPQDVRLQDTPRHNTPAMPSVRPAHEADTPTPTNTPQVTVGTPQVSASPLPDSRITFSKNAKNENSSAPISQIENSDTADTQEIAASLIRHGVTAHTARKLAKDFPSDCRRHLATFRPELHKNPAAYLYAAITRGYAPDTPKVPVNGDRMPIQRASVVPPTLTPDAQEHAETTRKTVFAGLRRLYKHRE